MLNVVAGFGQVHISFFFLYFGWIKKGLEEESEEIKEAISEAQVLSKQTLQW